MRRRLQWCLIALAALGCEAAIEPPSEPSPPTGGGGTGGSVMQPGPNGPMDIGFSPAARLNRTQYNNTVRDLLGTSLTPASSFPPDETTLGFDTIAGVLRVQPEHLEKYLAASGQLVDELLARPASDPVRTKYFTCDAVSGGANCQRDIVRNLASKAWRRPASDQDLAPYLTLAAAQPSAQEGLSAALRAVLSSPRFLYRLELDPSPDAPGAHRLDGYELASRLSYFLWSTMPDDALFAAAQSGALLSDEGLTAQVSRMLGSAERARTFVSTFGAQWLNVDRLSEITPDAMLFPEFDDAARQAMLGESKEFIWDFLTNGRPVAEMLTADFTFANARLASLYGLSGVSGDNLRRVSTQGAHRSGAMTLGSYLAGNSNPTRTSPVKRGLHVLDRWLCSSPPPPPPGVNVNIDTGSGLENLSVRQRLAEHQKKGAACAACHQTMDAIGLGLENFDAIGRYRSSDEFGPIDASGELPGADGKGKMSFNGAVELAKVLSADPRLLPCVVEKVLTFGVGRAFEDADQPLRDAVAARAVSQGGSLRAAVEAVVTSEVFRSRRSATSSEVMP